MSITWDQSPLPTWDSTIVKLDGSSGAQLPDATLVQRALVSVLNAIFANAVYPNVAPDSKAAPFAVYSVISTVPQNTLADGAPLDNSRYQVDVYASSYAQAQALAQSVRFAVLAIPFPISVTLALQADLYEADVKLHRVTQDFSIFSPRSVA